MTRRSILGSACLMKYELIILNKTGNQLGQAQGIVSDLFLIGHWSTQHRTREHHLQQGLYRIEKLTQN